ncbi:MAG: nascent polypeptide-associated complex protein [Nanoarchaeota archaeon]
MLGGLDPKKMQAMMRQMGIKQEDVGAERVIIEKENSKIIIEPANVQKIIMQGQESWQITGNSREETKENEINEADIQMVVEKSGVSKENARKALEGSDGDIAAAILKLGE